MQDLNFLENCLLVCLLLMHTEVFPVLIYFYVLTALWLPMLEQIFFNLWNAWIVNSRTVSLSGYRMHHL